MEIIKCLMFLSCFGSSIITTNASPRITRGNPDGALNEGLKLMQTLFVQISSTLNDASDSIQELVKEVKFSAHNLKDSAKRQISHVLNSVLLDFDILTEIADNLKVDVTHCINATEYKIFKIGKNLEKDVFTCYQVVQTNLYKVWKNVRKESHSLWKCGNGLNGFMCTIASLAKISRELLKFSSGGAFAPVDPKYKLCHTKHHLANQSHTILESMTKCLTDKISKTVI